MIQYFIAAAIFLFSGNYFSAPITYEISKDFQHIEFSDKRKEKKKKITQFQLGKGSLSYSECLNKDCGFVYVVNEIKCKDGTIIKPGTVFIYDQEMIREAEKYCDPKQEGGQIHAQCIYNMTGQKPSEFNGELFCIGGRIKNGKIELRSEVVNSSKQQCNDSDYLDRRREVQPDIKEFLQTKFDAALSSEQQEKRQQTQTQNNSNRGTCNNETQNNSNGGTCNETQNNSNGGTCNNETQNNSNRGTSNNETQNNSNKGTCNNETQYLQIQLFGGVQFKVQDIPQQGAYIDLASHKFSLFEKKDYCLQQEETDLIIYELMNVYKYGEPWFSLNPIDTNNLEIGQKKVYSCEYLKNTLVGQIMWKADWDLKQLGFGIKYDDKNATQLVNEKDICQKIPTYKSLFSLPHSDKKRNLSRLWFVIDKVISEEYSKYKRKFLHVKEIKLGVKAMDLEIQYNKLEDITTNENSKCKVFARNVTQNIDQFCQMYQSFNKLKDVMHLWVIVKQYMQLQQKLSLDQQTQQKYKTLFFQKYITKDYENIVPILKREETIKQKTYTSTQQIQGDVSFQSQKEEFLGKKQLHEDFIKNMKSQQITNNIQNSQLFKEKQCTICQKNNLNEILELIGLNHQHRSCNLKEEGHNLYKKGIQLKNQFAFKEAHYDLENAIEYYMKGAKIGGNLDCCFAAGLAYMELGQYETAIEFFKKSISDNSNEDEQKMFKRAGYLFRQQLQEKQYGKAQLTILQASLFDLNNQNLLKQMEAMEKIDRLMDDGRQLFKQEKYELAFNTFNLGLTIEGIEQFSKTIASLKFNMSMCCQKLNQKKQEMTLLQEALQRNLGHENAQKHLANFRSG